ncbi:glutathione S-transferase [Lutimaribacter pacificus]|uniref:Glutathione S-transferase n=1 Tax=Lutimaribacter pacificus TaxID=391948 RepID=A0A1H0B1Y0_9RHOB|nr:glutathione S-transferase family protein [Lutimaribacter pacificus]SDN39687.1 glutathione S-transferase [Lutimaribacter pacificus]SHJ61396.1 glutathione S-transferase [Lutimaribacter pacificus]
MTEAGDLTLIGFHDSVYTWAVRWALAETGLPARSEEVDPFTPDGAAALRGVHPFGLVPVLRHGDFTLYETPAILRYLDRLQAGADLTPAAPRAGARMAQVMSVVTTQVYWPLVRQVFSNGYYLPRAGQDADRAALEAGLSRAPLVLDALEQVAGEGLVLTGQGLTLADLMLAPMLAYFNAVPDAARLTGQRTALSAWLDRIAARPGFIATMPPCLAEGGA